MYLHVGNHAKALLVKNCPPCSVPWWIWTRLLELQVLHNFAQFSKECFVFGLMSSMTKIDDPWSFYRLKLENFFLGGDSLKYFGPNTPMSLAIVVIAKVVIVGGAEYYMSTNKSPLGSVCFYPIHCHGISINYVHTNINKIACIARL